MKKSIAFAEITTLSGPQPLQKIVDIILSIDNFKSDTQNRLNKVLPYKEQGLVPLKNLWVDLNYQRRLKIQKLINRLIASGGFDKEVAGHVDVAIRSNGKMFLWDGFHRAIKAAISGLTEIPVSIYEHDKTLSAKDQLKKEAKMFKVRNADSSAMKPEEIFKSEIVFEDPIALQILDLLIKCKLDVERQNLDPEAISLGGFAVLKKVWDKMNPRFYEEASAILRRAFPTEKTMSVILWCGLTKLLETQESDDAVTTVSISTLSDAFVDIVKNDITLKQSSFTQPRLHGKAIESTARNILRMGLGECFNDNGKEVNSMIKYMGIDEEEFDDEIS